MSCNKKKTEYTYIIFTTAHYYSVISCRTCEFSKMRRGTYNLLYKVVYSVKVSVLQSTKALWTLYSQRKEYQEIQNIILYSVQYTVSAVLI
jgi:hypothetical protein